MRRFVKPIEEIFSDALGRLPLSTNMTGSGYQIVKDTEVDHESSDLGKEIVPDKRKSHNLWNFPCHDL